ncbi:MAG TPA: sigma-54 dependent transcriptional regulator, partial [Gemmatimonadaceae bacterium]|nr:sigma-54 dependent transcriptional regulator [Gemmatimonadaceae bacterium]
MKVLLTLTDVEPAVRLNKMLEAADVETEVVSPLDDVRAVLARQKPDLIVFTGELRDPSNVALVREQLWAGRAVVGLADTDDPEALERLRGEGYTEVYGKPANLDEVFDGVRRALERQRLQRTTGLLGESEAIREVLVKVEQMAPVTSTVLIEGESGTGKELVARAIHATSPRAQRPFVAVDCGAIAEGVLESELFGHARGAFTGAQTARRGLFEEASGGTIFLDEIGDVGPNLQARLLRVLQEGTVRPVGTNEARPVDARVVAATNKDLEREVRAGKFREDLFYRLAVVTIRIPPLRERREDIALLAEHFAAKHGSGSGSISPAARDLLVAYPWPGNVRELENVIARALALNDGGAILPQDLPEKLRTMGAPGPVGVNLAQGE